MGLVLLAVMFFACMILYKPGFKFFLIWLGICVVLSFIFNGSIGFWGVVIYLFIYGSDGYSEEKPTKKYSSDRSTSKKLYDKVYADGSHRVENLSNTGYYYSNGEESWVGMLGEEHRSNGEVVRENAYIPGRRDIYNSAGEYIGYEYEDSIGITHRVAKE